MDDMNGKASMEWGSLLQRWMAVDTRVNGRSGKAFRPAHLAIMSEHYFLWLWLSPIALADANYPAEETCSMNVNQPVQPWSGNMDVDEFMEFLQTRPHGEHWELIEGAAVMMAPASYAHQRIVRNLCELLNSAFAMQRLDLFAYFDAGVRSPGVRNFQPQPDVVVVPGVAGYDLYSERFQLVAEVLSPTNTRTEIGLKLRRYREAPQNLYAVLVEPHESLVEIYARRNDWQSIRLTSADDPIEIPEFGLRCRVGDLYRGTPLDPLTQR